ncbi:mechanosensitive ion channel family protein [Psychrosphaera sp. 1_MG-2023]|uniref:Small-conductance mechanosensitive channel n=1 Tax=Psychrosphaera algicola TaxID=3023714 RepID=A0ABT5FCW0_9GAMM|nr:MULTISPECIES: mechanosensitive ion channel family protein [unclassified Psychrosphaera]MDC2889362.1 mechanosensitive ion channel family protein [Psychrosphaera sp. G1-22]MDO6718319.1 mechanosensitive ion channel family protein [Psychrosphaera sp. 1_MG-2023]
MDSTTEVVKQQSQESLAAADLLKNEIDQVAKIYDIMIEFFTNYSFQLVGAFIIFIIGYMIAGKVGNMVLAICERNKLDITLSRFLSNTSKMLFVVMVLIIALGKLGISVTPFVAAIGAASLGAGLALQGLLANYAAGFNIIMIRPFVVGDTLTVQGVTGVVQEVLLAYTIVVDEDGAEIIIPNKHIVGEILHNSKSDTLLELSVGIDYSHNPLEVVELIQKALAEMDVVSSNKAPEVGIDQFADSSINIGIRLWTATVGLHTTRFETNKMIYELLHQHNIKIPFPQRDIHIVSGNAA